MCAQDHQRAAWLLLNHCSRAPHQAAAQDTRVVRRHQQRGGGVDAGADAAQQRERRLRAQPAGGEWGSSRRMCTGRRSDVSSCADSFPIPVACPWRAACVLSTGNKLRRAPSPAAPHPQLLLVHQLHQPAVLLRGQLRRHLALLRAKEAATRPLLESKDAAWGVFREVACPCNKSERVRAGVPAATCWPNRRERRTPGWLPQRAWGPQRRRCRPAASPASPRPPPCRPALLLWPPAAFSRAAAVHAPVACSGEWASSNERVLIGLIQHALA